MTNRAALLKLRDRLKAATGPDVSIDNAIFATLRNATWYEEPRGFRSGTLRWEDGSRVGVRDVPAHTASLDAAVTLVDGEDRFWRVGHDGEGPDPSAFKAEFLAVPARKVEATADTPALALCLARVEYELAKTTPAEPI